MTGQKVTTATLTNVNTFINRQFQKLERNVDNKNNY